MAADEPHPSDMASVAGRDAQVAARELGVGESGRPLQLIRTRKVALRTFACIGLLVIIAAEIFGPGWILWVPLMTILGLTLAGLEKILRLGSSDDTRDD